MTTRQKPGSRYPETTHSDTRHSTHSHSGSRRSGSRQRNEQPFQYEHEKIAWRKAIKNHFIAASGEFIGTVMFLWFAFAAHLMIVNQTAEKPQNNNSGNSAQTVVFISLAYGFSLLVTAWGWYRISGGVI